MSGLNWTGNHDALFWDDARANKFPAISEVYHKALTFSAWTSLKETNRFLVFIVLKPA